jgi:hypothetical protein
LTTQTKKKMPSIFYIVGGKFKLTALSVQMLHLRPTHPSPFDCFHEICMTSVWERERERYYVFSLKLIALRRKEELLVRKRQLYKSTNLMETVRREKLFFF